MPDITAHVTTPVIKEWVFSRQRILGIVLLGVFVAALTYMMQWVIYRAHAGDADVRLVCMDIVALTLGVACGWLAGTVSSPAAAAEWERFTLIGRGIGTFISGFVLSQAQPLIKQALTLSNWRTHEEAAFRILVTITGFLLSTMVTYILRVSLLPPGSEDERKKALEDSKTELQLVKDALEKATLQKQVKTMLSE